MRRVITSLLIFTVSAAVASGTALACVAFHGYGGINVGNVDQMASSVSTTSAVFGVTDESDYIVDDIQYIVNRSGPVLVSLSDIIFNPTKFTGIDCTHYERGSTNEEKSWYKLRGNFKSRLDTFFATNSALFTDCNNHLVHGIVVHNEANNACVENWKLQNAADYVKQKLDALQPRWRPIRVLAGYGLRNIAGTGAVSEGLPVDSSGAIKQFPSKLDTVGYWAYDIFDPNNPSDPRNLNAEPWDQIRNKLDQALNGHSTIAVIKAYCQPGAPEESGWGVTCPNDITELEQLAVNWSDYLGSDTANIGAVLWLWPDAAGGIYGSTSLPALYNEHSSFGSACALLVGCN